MTPIDMNIHRVGGGKMGTGGKMRSFVFSSVSQKTSRPDFNKWHRNTPRTLLYLQHWVYQYELVCFSWKSFSEAKTIFSAILSSK